MSACILGQLRITGDIVRFYPSGDVVSVPRDDEVEIAVRYDYAEASHDKELCAVAFDLHHPEDGLRTVSIAVKDRPVLRDASVGMLVHRARFRAPGDVRVRFELRVDSATGPWLGRRDATESAARHEGEVLVRVQ